MKKMYEVTIKERDGHGRYGKYVYGSWFAFATSKAKAAEQARGTLCAMSYREFAAKIEYFIKAGKSSTAVNDWWRDCEKFMHDAYIWTIGHIGEFDENDYIEPGFIAHQFSLTAELYREI